MSSEVTLKQIANALGVSTMTVSRAMNNSDKVSDRTKKKIRAKAREMGYTPNHIAKSLLSQKTNTIGVVIPEIHHMFFSQVISGIESVIYENNYHLFLTNSSEEFEREKDVIETLRSRRVDGILISCAEDSNQDEYYKGLIDSGTKMVFFDRCVENIGASCVCVNDRLSSHLITKHLIDHGYKRIAHLAGSSNLSISRERFGGYKDALEESGLDFDEALVKTSGFREDGGYKAMQLLLEETKGNTPEAVVAVNDPVAFGAIKAIIEAGLTIPDDIAIVGFSDDIRSELMPVPLTTIEQPAYQMGVRAAKKLIKLIESDAEPIENIYMNTSLVIRKSCGTHNDL
ncbi:MAG: LacI family DNA-binding transcriptional regulator [Balneolaceae bacterium]